MDLSILRILRERAGADVPAALLCDGLPPTLDPAPVAGDAAAPATTTDLVSAWLDSRPDRRATGLYLTPRTVARALLSRAADEGLRPRRILDPAVGAGVFLEEAWSLFGPEVELHGVDIDPVAVALTRLALWNAGAVRDPELVARRILWGDALRSFEPSADGAFDLVCGNPPFGNAIEKRTGRSGEGRRELKERFPETAVGPYDRSVLFVHLAAQLLAPGGRYALLAPRALLSARYATPLRRLLARESPLRRLVLFPGDRPAPECGIAMVGVIGGSGPAPRCVAVTREDGELLWEVPPGRLEETSWGALFDPECGGETADLERHLTFGDLFDVRASMTVSEAYAIRDSLQEDGKGWRFLTAGLIVRHGDRWGHAPARYLGRTFARPVLPREAPGLSRNRRAFLDRPKLIVAGLSRSLRARCDLRGRCAGSVGTLMLLARGDGPDAERMLLRAGLLLNSDWLTSIHRTRRGPQALSGGSIPLGRRDIEAFPFPESLAKPNHAIDEDGMRAHVEAFDRAAQTLSDDPEGGDQVLPQVAEAILRRILDETTASTRSTK